MASPKVTDPGPAPLLFGFRGIRLLQVIFVIGAGALAIGGVVLLKAYLDGESVFYMPLAIVFAALFIWLFATAIRLPTSFVAISPDRMRIRFGGFVDTIIDTREVSGAQLVNWPLWKGLGVRTSFGGDAALVAGWGPVAEITLKHPIRIWLIPRLWRVRATRITLSVRNPHKMVDRFGYVPSNSSNAKKKRR